MTDELTFRIQKGIRMMLRLRFKIQNTDSDSDSDSQIFVKINYTEMFSVRILGLRSMSLDVFRL